MLALVDLGLLDDLLLDLRAPAPELEHTRVLLVVLAKDETLVIGTERGLEHTLSPGPPGVHHLLGDAEGIIQTTKIRGRTVFQSFLLPDVFDLVELLFLTGVGNLGDGGDTSAILPLVGSTDAAKVTVTDLVNVTVTPDLTVLLGDLELLVDVDPATATGTLIGENLLGQVIGALFDAHADVDVVLAVGKADLLPELGVVGLEFHAPAGLDGPLLHVLLAVLLLADGQGPEAVGEEVNNRQLEVGEEVLKLGHPLHADETLTAD